MYESHVLKKKPFLIYLNLFFSTCTVSDEESVDLLTTGDLVQHVKFQEDIKE